MTMMKCFSQDNMEKDLYKIAIQNMGENTSKVFAGDALLKACQETYNETPDVFANEIKKRLSDSESHNIADLGSFKGELLQQIIGKLPSYDFKTIAVDINEDAIKDNQAETKIVADLKKLPFENKSVDVEIVRYVLQWNYWENQKKILQEVARTVKDFALIEHAGADSKEPDEYRKRAGSLFSGEEIPKLKRGENFFSSRKEIEDWLNDEGIKFERIEEKIINNVSEVYTERFGLSPEENIKTKEILGDKDFLIKTDWVIYPKNG